MNYRRSVLARLCLFASGIIALIVLLPMSFAAGRSTHHLLYVAVPGIRNETQWGGIGVLVYDMDHGHRLLKRIPTLKVEGDQQPEAIKGICASARTGRLYLTTTARLLCLDLQTESLLWNKPFDGGCDRMAISPDGARLYMPSLEGPYWNVVEAATGNLLSRIVTNSGSHNTACGLDGHFVYLAGLKSPLLAVADCHTQTVVKTVGPFSNVVRPFTVNGRQTLCFVNVNDLLGFEVGDLNTGRKLYRVEVAGYATGPVKRHGCPSHGIGLTPDEKELWLSDGANTRLHVFDATHTPPTQGTSILLRDQPGWITFSLDGHYAYPSTGDVIDTHSKQIVTTLADEAGHPVQSEKLVEIDFSSDKPTQVGDQFGLGRKR